MREDFGSEGSVFENQFTVETRNDGVFPFWDVPDYAKDPRFASEPVGPGDCSRGWITFQIPDGERIERVHWRPVKDSPESLSWEVGGS